MALTFKSFGKGLAKAAKVAAPFAGFALGPMAGIGLGLAGGLGHGKQSLKKMALGGLAGGAGALAGKVANVSKLGVLGGAKNLGGKAVSGLAKAGKQVGGSLASTFQNDDGSLNLQSLLGLGLGASAFKGARDENKAASSYNAGNAAMRQALMERLSQGPDYSALMNRITAQPNYNFK